MTNDDAPLAWQDDNLVDALLRLLQKAAPHLAALYTDPDAEAAIEEARDAAACALNPYAGVQHNELVTVLRKLLEITQWVAFLRDVLEEFGPDTDEGRGAFGVYASAFCVSSWQAFAVLLRRREALANVAQRAVDEMLQAARQGK